ncbi:hypothetical protein HGR_04873 [Hylemonella gracilis ATCC 19624]|uniref:Uncharacterized protein n=1 Tax=Hylemonella gracilis ATCC 19624 TaxID=887062 RepID=F3KR99_9BURK|nr:hypothetical protein HGR_04873 [Hylemonella gracilis ATCC 19624]
MTEGQLARLMRRSETSCGLGYEFGQRHCAASFAWASFSMVRR